MPGNVPHPVLIYRIVDYRNLPFILKNGLCCPNFQVPDSSYINIGMSDIIQKRNGKDVMLPPYGKLHDYIPFYFAPRSPMLYSIHRGKSDYLDSQEKIIYLVTSVEKVEEVGLQYVFTDGQAIMQTTRFFNSITDLANVDWDIMKLQYWDDKPPEFPDRKRKRQAEFLVYRQMPVDIILGIAVMNENIYSIVTNIVADHNSTLRVVKRPQWYY